MALHSWTYIGDSSGPRIIKKSGQESRIAITLTASRWRDGLGILSLSIGYAKSISLNLLSYNRQSLNYTSFLLRPRTRTASTVRPATSRYQSYRRIHKDPQPRVNIVHFVGFRPGPTEVTVGRTYPPICCMQHWLLRQTWNGRELNTMQCLLVQACIRFERENFEMRHDTRSACANYVRVPGESRDFIVSAMGKTEGHPNMITVLFEPPTFTLKPTLDQRPKHISVSIQ